MAITKRKLAEQALRIIQGGAIRDDSEIDIREIIKVKEYIFRLIVKEICISDIRNKIQGNESDKD